MGALAAGGAAGLGTGAFSAMTADRDAYIDVVNDADGLLGLEVGGEANGRVSENENGELEIDFTSEEGGEGVNVNSRYQVGEFNNHVLNRGWSDSVIDPRGGDPGFDLDRQDNAAFRVHNNDGQDHEVTLEYEVDEESDAFIGFQISRNNVDGGAGMSYIGVWGSSDSATFTLNPGEFAGVSIAVDTRDVDDFEDSDLSGTLTVSAN